MAEESSERPLIFIVDAAVQMTGGLMAARRETMLLSDRARAILALPSTAGIAESTVPEFERVLRLPLAQLRKSVPNVLLYIPRLLRSGYRLRRELAKAGCDRLQVNDLYLLEGSVARLLGYRGRIVTWVRIEPSRLGKLFGTLCLALARRTSSHVIAVSEHICRSLPPGYNATVLYEPATDIAPDKPAMTGRRLVFIGNYTEGKGQDLAIAAFGQVAPDFPDAELHFFGGDMGLDKNRAYRERLKQLAAIGPAASQIHFQGFVEHTGPVLDKALAALNLSQSESFSLTCQEASARGVAVIATDCGGPAEIIDDGVTGYLVPVGDVDAIADRMRRLLSEPELALQMGRAGIKLVRDRFRADRFVHSLVDIFDLPRHPSGQ